MERLARCSVGVSHGASKMRTLQVEMQDGEVRDGLEHFEPYGFTSEPHTDKKTDAVAGFFDNTKAHGIVLIIADRRYRITQLKPGEVCVYDDKNRYIYFKEDALIVDGANLPITVKTDNTVTVNANTVKVDASTVTISSTGSLELNGADIKINSSGELSFSGTKIGFN